MSVQQLRAHSMGHTALMLGAMVMCGGCSLLFHPDDGDCSLQLVIEDNTDDGEVGTFDSLQLFPDGEVNSSPAGLYLGHWAGTKTSGYFRFALPASVPSDAAFAEAHLRLWGRTISNWNIVNDQLEVRLEDVADAQVVEDPERAPPLSQSSPMIALQVAWPETGGLDWREQAFNESPNLAEMFNQLAESQNGLVAGAHVQLWVSGNFDDADRELATDDFSGGAVDGHQAQLVLDRCPR